MTVASGCVKIRKAKGGSPVKNLIFIGMPAVGKSTVGVVTAKRLGYHFIDVDILIQVSAINSALNSFNKGL